MILLEPVGLCRSGVEPPTGKLHPRKGGGTTDRKRESIKRFIAEDVFPGLELREDIWRGWIVPVGGSTPDRRRNGAPHLRLIFLPCRKKWMRLSVAHLFLLFDLRLPELCRSGVGPPTGRLHPRKDGGTTDKKRESIKRFVAEDVFPGLELREDIWRGWIVPVRGSTPDRLRKGRRGARSKRYPWP